MLKLPANCEVLIVQSPYYPHISKGLRDGAEAVLRQHGVYVRTIAVPGALEIPAAINMVHQHFAARNESVFRGYIALGCVIRGETSHYDIVSQESASGLQQIAIKHQLCIGNGILTVEDEAQAIVRSDPKQLDKGGFAAQACIEMMALKHQLASGQM
ncbi:MAG: 6,7-dimethyl-8-ribityllumazine synthase [Candidatus Pacebacteria bacterium]|nr:6,7-dimethyl-8-ribityllumazine synthase [Candidatus Paceibacterota bacterium]